MKTESVSEIIRTTQMGDTLYILATEAEEELKLISDSYEANKQGWEAEIAELKKTIEVRDGECKTEHYDTLIAQDKEIAALRYRERVLVEILRRTWSLLCEIGSPNCNMELARKDVNMMAEEIRAALAAKEG